MKTDITVKSYKKERESELLEGLYASMTNVGALVMNQAKKNVWSPLPSGKTHPYYKDKNILASNIIYRVESTRGSLMVAIGTNTKYGKYLEFGTIKMPAYPWLFPAVEMSRNEIKKALIAKTFAAGLQTTVGEYGVSEEVQTTDVKEF